MGALQGGAAVAHRAHNPGVAGAIPAPATIWREGFHLVVPDGDLGQEHGAALGILGLLADWMRKQGVRRARLGDVELEFEQTPTAAVAEPPVIRLKTDEEIARDRRELKRRRYEAELGARIDDRTLDSLP